MIYLLHFSKPFQHAKHYLGYADDERVLDRILEHVKGQGANIIKHALRKGIYFEVARVMPGNRIRERQLKAKIRKISPYCPICNHPLRVDLKYYKLARKYNYELAKVLLKKGFIKEESMNWISI